jgi:FHA domain
VTEARRGGFAPARLSSLLAPLFALLLLFLSGRAKAAPEAHILRIDPRGAVEADAPILTTVVEVVQFNSTTTALEPCATVKGFSQRVDCMSDILEKPRSTWTAFPFLKDKATLLVKVDGRDRPATVEGDPKTWAQSIKEPNVGTAWLVVLDAAAGMGSRYLEAREVANDFIRTMQPNDLMNIMIFDDQQVFKSSRGWKTYAQRAELANVLKDVGTTAQSHGRDRALFEQIKKMATDGFNDLGNSSSPQSIPLHQAMVILSNGAGRNDVASSAPVAEEFRRFATKGRFPEDNAAAPKTPLPVISIWFPSASSLLNDVYKNNDQQFMQALANPEVGGFFDIVRDIPAGEIDTRSKRILKAIRERFDAMYVVKWRLSCLASDVEQSFDLEFAGTSPPIKGDATFQNVPIGVDPSQWPLSIDVAKTKAEAEASPVFPGGTFKVYGDFCWAGDKTRAEAYFIPPGYNPNMSQGADLASVKKAMQGLISQNMRATAKDANDEFAVFDVPDDPKLLDGAGDSAVAHLIVLDNKAYRSSGRDAKNILTLKAKKAPPNLVVIIAASVGGLIVLLLLIVLFRGGGGGGRKRVGNAPPPVVAGGGYGGGGPGGGYGGPAGGYGGQAGYGGGAGQGGGYQASPSQAGAGGGTAPLAVSAGAASVVQVTCPSCKGTTMATPGQPSVCFSCGQPLPAELTAAAGAPYPLTGEHGEAALTPPPNPYGAPPGATGATRALIVGPVGQFPILPGSEVRVGRDAQQCAVALAEPRISGVHSTLKFEASHLWVRDEQSNNGTYVAGERIPPGAWRVVPSGRALRFGPIEFDVRLES